MSIHHQSELLCMYVYVHRLESNSFKLAVRFIVIDIEGCLLLCNGARLETSQQDRGQTTNDEAFGYGRIVACSLGVLFPM
jgi:hypothetical protein